jgi:hypothetical protein
MYVTKIDQVVEKKINSDDALIFFSQIYFRRDRQGPMTRFCGDESWNLVKRHDAFSTNQSGQIVTLGY